MDENLLYGLRRNPPEEFARTLQAALERSESDRGNLAPGMLVTSRKRVRATAIALSVVALACSFAFPSVRAGAQAFLDLFRVVNFAAVPFNSERLSQLRSTQLDFPQLLGGQIQVLKEPGSPVSFDSPAAAGTAAGMHLFLPAWTPVGWDISSVKVLGERAVRVTADTSKLQQVLDALGIDDVSIPLGLDGKSATLRVLPAVAVEWRNGNGTVHLLQAPTPNVQIPPGTDLAVLGEIGLRIMGLSSGEAHRFAQNIDWRTTLIVPVPVNAASFRQVDVQGHPGLLVESADPAFSSGEAGREGSPRHHGTVLLWSSGDRVFALQGALGPPQLLEMAQSLQ